MNVFASVTISFSLSLGATSAIAQQGGVGPVMSTDQLLERCENGLLFEKSLQDEELLTIVEKQNAFIDYTFCLAFVTGVFEGARYVHTRLNPDDQKFCADGRTLEDFVRLMISAREMSPEMRMPGRMASSDILQLLEIFWKCE